MRQESVTQGLVNARGLIEKGWKQGGFVGKDQLTGNATFCTRAAIGMAFVGDAYAMPHAGTSQFGSIGIDHPAWQAEVLLMQVLGLKGGHGRLEEWNDSLRSGFFRGDPKARVLNTFDKAIAEAKRQEATVEARQAAQLAKMFVLPPTDIVLLPELEEPVEERELVHV